MTERYRPVKARHLLIHGMPMPAPPAMPVYKGFKPPPAADQEVLSNRKRIRAERLKLLAYALTIVLSSALSEPLTLLTILSGTLLTARQAAPRLLGKALTATVAFTATVSLAYAAQAYWLSGHIPWAWLGTLNLRVLTMACLTFFYRSRANLFTALGFSKGMTLVLVLAVSQSSGMRRTLEEFRLGLRSRVARRASLRDRYRAAASAAVWLLDRTIANAHETAQALQSRGLLR
jgi:cobalt/nickel transport system permease protein